MRMSFATMYVAERIGTGYTFKGDVGDWYMLPNDSTSHQMRFFCLDSHRNVIEQTDIDPREDFDFIPA